MKQFDYETFKKSILRYIQNSESDYMASSWDVMNILSTINEIDRILAQRKKDTKKEDEQWDEMKEVIDYLRHQQEIEEQRDEWNKKYPNMKTTVVVGVGK